MCKTIANLKKTERMAKIEGGKGVNIIVDISDPTSTSHLHIEPIPYNTYICMPNPSEIRVRGNADSMQWECQLSLLCTYLNEKFYKHNCNCKRCLLSFTMQQPHADKISLNLSEELSVILL